MNLPRITAMVLACVLALLVETVLVPGLSIGGVAPPVVVCTVVGFALGTGSDVGLRYGFAAGLAIDLVSGGLVGLSALVFLLAGYAAGNARPYLSGAGFVGPIVVAAAVAAGSTFSYGLLSLLLDPGRLTAGALLAATLASAVYGALLAPVVVRPLAGLCARLEAQVGVF